MVFSCTIAQSWGNWEWHTAPLPNISNFDLVANPRSILYNDSHSYLKATVFCALSGMALFQEVSKWIMSAWDNAFDGNEN